MKKMKVILVLLAIATAVPFFNACKKGEKDPFLSLRSRKARVAGEWTVSAYEYSSDNTETYSDPNSSTAGNIVKREGTNKSTYDGTTITESSTSKNTQDDGKTTSSATTTSGAAITYSNTNSSGTTTSTSGTYANTLTWTYIFEKDGTFKMSKTSNKKVESTDDSNTAYKKVETDTDDKTETVEGTWAFIGKDKTNDFKKNERIGLWYSSNNSNTVSENKETYTDKVSTDFYDYTNQNSTNKNTNDRKITGKDETPSEVWEIDQLKNKEMKVIVKGTSTNNGTSTNSNTNSSGTTTSTTSTSTTTNNWTGNLTLKAK